MVCSELTMHFTRLNIMHIEKNQRHQNTDGGEKDRIEYDEKLLQTRASVPAALSLARTHIERVVFAHVEDAEVQVATIGIKLMALRICVVD